MTNRNKTKEDINLAIQVLLGAIHDLEDDEPKKDQLREVVDRLIKFRESYCYVVSDCWEG